MCTDAVFSVNAIISTYRNATDFDFSKGNVPHLSPYELRSPRAFKASIIFTGHA